MKTRTPTYTNISIKAVVDQLEPDRLTRPEMVYPDIRNPYHNSERPYQPGKKYPWAPEIPDDE